MEFRDFFEYQMRSLDGKGKHFSQEKKTNYITGMQDELSISPESIPEFIETGPIEMDGYWFNQAIWRVGKVMKGDPFIRVYLHQLKSPNLNQKIYRKNKKGKMVPYDGEIPSKPFLISFDDFARIFGRDWEPVIQQQQQGGGM